MLQEYRMIRPFTALARFFLQNDSLGRERSWSATPRKMVQHSLLRWRAPDRVTRYSETCFSPPRLNFR